MDADFVAIAHCLLARDANGTLFHGELDVVFADPGQLNDGHEVVVLLKDIDRREGADTAGRVSEPIA